MRLTDILNKYSLLDARELGDFLPRETKCIDVTISSPPYWNIKDYGTKAQIGFGQTYEAYLDDIERVFKVVHAATKPTGSLWIVADTFKQDGELRLLPFDITQRLRTSGWILQDIIIWQKDRSLPWSHQGKLRNIFEYVAFYSKSKRFKYQVAGIRDINDLKDYWVRYPERYSPQGKTPSRAWAIPIPRQGVWGEAGNYIRHACPLPHELVERILRLTTSPGDVVFDPFAGSGAVLATASAMGRRFIGTDLNRKYQQMFYDDVLPAVVRKHKTRRNSTNQQNTARSKFSSAVLALRCLKFPKELVRLYRAEFGTESITSILVIPSRNRRQLAIVFCFSDNKHIPPSFLKRARALADRRPLSKYGVQVNLMTVGSSEALALLIRDLRLNRTRQLHVYKDGRFYEWEDRTTVGALQRSDTDLFTRVANARFPRVLCPLGLKLSPTNQQHFFEAQNGQQGTSS